MSEYLAETPRLYLQLLDVDKHLDDYHAMFCDPRVITTTPRTYPVPLELTRTKILSRSPTPSTPWAMSIAILSKSHTSLSEVSKSQPSSSSLPKPRLIGTIGIGRAFTLPPPTSSCSFTAAELAALGLDTDIGRQDQLEFGYGLHPDFFGQGFGIEAAMVFKGVIWGLEGENFKGRKVLIARTSTGNLTSQRMLGKLGAKRWCVVERGQEMPGVLGEDGVVGPSTWEDLEVWVVPQPGLI